MVKPYEVLSAWEQGEAWPDVDEFVECVTELGRLEQLVARYRRLIVSCEMNESLRHSQESSLTPYCGDDTPDLCGG